MALSEDAAAIVASNLTVALVTAAKNPGRLYLNGMQDAEGMEGSRMLVENIYTMLLYRVGEDKITFHEEPPES